jgi:predicted transposase YdaD
MNLSTVYLKQRETWKQEGLEEGLKTVAIALLREGVDLELILKTTGLDRETLQTLQAQLT